MENRWHPLPSTLNNIKTSVHKKVKSFMPVIAVHAFIRTHIEFVQVFSLVSHPHTCDTKQLRILLLDHGIIE